MLPGTDVRRYRNVWLEISKKQGKSETLAALSLKQLAFDNEQAAEVYGCAADKNQASIIYDVAVDMLDQFLEDFPRYKQDFKVVQSKKRIIYYPTRSFYQVVSAEAYTKHGLNVSTVIFDEIHAQPNRNLYDVMTFGSGDARKQPLFLFITTAGDDPDRQSIGWELHQYNTDLLLGNKVDPSWYSVIYGIDEEEKRIWKGKDYEPMQEGEDWRSERIWKLVNPSMDITTPLDKFREAYTTASQSPGTERLFKWLRLNMWLRYSETKWLSQDLWDACEDTYNEESLLNRTCYGGLDLATKNDIAAFVLLFPPKDETEKWKILWRFFIPKEYMAKRIKEDKVKYDEWVREGHMIATNGWMIDYKTIEDEILKLAKLYDIKEIGYDEWNAYQMVQNLSDSGAFMPQQLLKVRQVYKELSEPIKILGSLIMNEEFSQDGNPVARWMFGNIEILQDNMENIKFIKDKDGKRRIDGMVALAMAMSRGMFCEDPTSIYEERDMISL